jgi:hypothetical protein
MKKSIKVHLIILGVVVTYTIAPIISVVGSLGLAGIAGCDGVNEGSAPNCKIEAVEDLVYTGFVAGWFGLLTLPTGGPISLMLLIALPIHHQALVKKSKDKPEP